MGALMEDNLADSVDLIECGAGGGPGGPELAFGPIPRPSAAMVEMRLDSRLQARIDASDVIQEAYVEVAERLDEYLCEPKLPLFLWLRLVVGERLLKLHRHHLGTQMRDAGLEVSIYRGALPAASSAALAAQLLGKHTSPTQAAMRAERMLRLQEALNSLDADRPRGPVAAALRGTEPPPRRRWSLGIEESAAAKRYIRALKRLKAILASMPGGLGRCLT